MSNAKTIGRLGMLAIGLGIGAAVAATPGIASADSNGLDTAAFDPSALIADPASTTIPGLDLAISIDGVSLFQSGSASAYSGTADIAIAYGNESTAVAGPTFDPGTFDYAFADGSDASAVAGIGNFNSATAIGSDSYGSAGAGTGDTAYADGTDTGAYAQGTYHLGTVNTVATAGNYSYASAIGNNDLAVSGAGVQDASSTVVSTGDIATIVGNSSDAYAGEGNYDFAGVLGDSLTSTAVGGNYLFDFAPSL